MMSFLPSFVRSARKNIAHCNIEDQWHTKSCNFKHCNLEFCSESVENRDSRESGHGVVGLAKVVEQGVRQNV